jgi:hypothetical protein
MQPFHVRKRGGGAFLWLVKGHSNQFFEVTMENSSKIPLSVSGERQPFFHGWVGVIQPFHQVRGGGTWLGGTGAQLVEYECCLLLVDMAG